MKPNIPDIIERFAVYRRTHPGWGCLHVVLEDPNYQDGHVQGCIDLAIEDGDTEGRELAEILLTMSKTQRSKLGRAVFEYRCKVGDYSKDGPYWIENLAEPKGPQK